MLTRICRRPGAWALPAVLLLGVTAVMADPTTTERAKQFVAAHDTKFKPLDRKASIAWWDANTTGKDEDFARKEKAQNEIDEALADPKPFTELKALKEASKSGQIDDK